MATGNQGQQGGRRLIGKHRLSTTALLNVTMEQVGRVWYTRGYIHGLTSLQSPLVALFKEIHFQ
jgi:hypothetical protein